MNELNNDSLIMRMFSNWRAPAGVSLPPPCMHTGQQGPTSPLSEQDPGNWVYAVQLLFVGQDKEKAEGLILFFMTKLSPDTVLGLLELCDHASHRKINHAVAAISNSFSDWLEKCM